MKDSKNISAEDKAEISEYLKLDIDLLYGMLARKFSDKGDLIKMGKSILEEVDEKLFQKICVDMGYCQNKSRFNYLDTQSLANLLFENIEPINYKESQIPPVLLSVILVKIGLSRFCKC